MAFTIVDASKLNSGDVARQAIVTMYARNFTLLRVLPFEEIEETAPKYNHKDILPGVGFRGMNQGFTESVGVLNAITESLVIAGGDLDVDRFITTTLSASQRSMQEGLKVKALAHCWTLAFIKGGSYADPGEFDGLQQYCMVDHQLCSDLYSTLTKVSSLRMQNLPRYAVFATCRLVLTVRRQ
jgi:hypothetical protein